MHTSSFLTIALVSVGVYGAVTPMDPIYEAAVSRQSVPAGMVLSAFEASGFAPNSTEEYDDGEAMDFYHFDFDAYQTVKGELLQKILAGGPSEPKALAIRQDGTNEAISCKFHNQYAYSYTVNVAAGGFSSMKSFTLVEGVAVVVTLWSGYS